MQKVVQRQGRQQTEHERDKKLHGPAVNEGPQSQKRSGVIFSLEGGRKQLVNVQKNDENGFDWRFPFFNICTERDECRILALWKRHRQNIAAISFFSCLLHCWLNDVVSFPFFLKEWGSWLKFSSAHSFILWNFPSILFFFRFWSTKIDSDIQDMLRQG